MNASGHQHGAIVGIICHHVLKRERRVNLVCHAPDGTWDFMCGEEDDEHDDVEKLSAICVQCGFHAFVAGINMDDIPIGSIAERTSRDAIWQIRAMTEKELADYYTED